MSGAVAPDASIDDLRFRRIALLLNEAEDVELSDLTVGEEAVDCVLLIHEQFEDGSQLREHQQFDIAFAQVQDLEGAAGLFHGGEADDQSAEARGIYVVDVLEIEDDVDLPGIHEFADLLA